MKATYHTYLNQRGWRFFKRIIYTIFFFVFFLADASNMNEGDSAGGGHQGPSPAPPAVPDRRSTFSTVNNQTTPTIITIATTHVTTASATATATLSAAQSTTVTTTSARSFQQVFTQQQLQLQQQQHQSLTPFSGGSAVINSSSVANNQSHHHMQQASTHYVAGVAATVSNPQQQKHQQRIFVTQIQTPTVSSYSSSALLATSATARTYISSTVGGAVPLATTNSSPLSKRLKIDPTTTESVVPGTGSNVISSLLPIILSTSEKTNVTAAAAAASPQQNVNTLKKLIIEQKYLRLRNLKEKYVTIFKSKRIFIINTYIYYFVINCRYSEHVAELFYLQSGGNMMDYPTWKKKPPSPQFINFCNAYRLDLLVNEDRTSATSATANIATQQQQTAENIATIIGVNSLNQHQPISQGVESATKTVRQYNGLFLIFFAKM